MFWDQVIFSSAQNSPATFLFFYSQPKLAELNLAHLKISSAILG
jgi:hypothetical protein